jgi:hypothetical protein
VDHRHCPVVEGDVDSSGVSKPYKSTLVRDVLEVELTPGSETEAWINDDIQSNHK